MSMGPAAVMIVLEGTVINCIEGQDYQYPAGSACLINRGFRHTEGFLSCTELSELFNYSADYLNRSCKGGIKSNFSI